MEKQMTTTATFGLRVRALRAADELEKLAAMIANPLEAGIHRKSAEIIRLLAEYVPTTKPALKVVK